MSNRSTFPRFLLATFLAAVSAGCQTTEDDPGAAGGDDAGAAGGAAGSSSGGDGGGATGGGGGSGGGDLDPDGDEDGDGRTNGQEVAGYPISVDETGDGTNSDRMVTSDPLLADTDGDGLTDAEEFAVKSDPRSVDTDGDTLTDFDEVKRWRTAPFDVDSDDDARGDPDDPQGSVSFEFFDNFELALVVDPSDAGRMIPGPGATSPVIADTDGDGAFDRDEQFSLRNPSVADLPRLRVELSENLSVGLNVEYNNGSDVTETIGAEFSSTQSNEMSRSDSSSITESSEQSVTLAVEASYFPPSASISAEATATVGLEETTTTEVTSTTAEAFTNAASQEQSLSQQYGEVAQSGQITGAVVLHNETNIPYEVHDLEIAVQYVTATPDGTRSTQTLATVVPTSALYSVAGQAFSAPIQLSSLISVDVARDFLTNPSALVVAPSNFTLTGPGDENFIFLTQENLNRTALVVVDYGKLVGGEVIRKSRVATLVDRVEESNAFPGIRLDMALATGGHDATFATDSEGAVVIASIDGVEATPLDHAPAAGEPIAYWAVIGRTENGVGRPDLEGVDLDAVRLRSQDTIRLVYIEDADRDGLNNREEFLFGTSDQAVDTDGDGLTDAEEVFGAGWTVTLLGEAPRQVRSSAAVADADADGLTDAGEQQAGSDPLDPDTDGDGLQDGAEVAGYVLEIKTMSGTESRTVSSDPTLVDGDGDGLTDLQEQGVSDPNLASTDGDLFPDATDLTPLSFSICPGTSANYSDRAVSRGFSIAYPDYGGCVDGSAPVPVGTPMGASTLLCGDWSEFGAFDETSFGYLDCTTIGTTCSGGGCQFASGVACYPDISMCGSTRCPASGVCP